MTARQRKRLLQVLGMLCLGIAAASLIVLALKENIQLYFTPSEWAQNRPPIDQRIRLGGLVLPGSLLRDPGDLKVVFTISDGAQDIRVNYTGILPDLFREGQGVIVSGYSEDNHQFHAVQVLTKHDERYVPKELKHTLKAMP